jgi:very-short-patch-repair endonuclease
VAVRYGVRLDADVDRNALTEIRAYAARMPPKAVFCGTTAAKIYGLPLPETHPPIEASASGVANDDDVDYDYTDLAQATSSPTTAEREILHVGMPAKKGQPRGRDVRGRRLSASLYRPRQFSGLRVLEPIETFVTACRDLAVEDAVVMLDALLTDKMHYPGLRLKFRPVTTLEAVSARLEELGPVSGIGVAKKAVELARCRVASPMETKLRLLLTAAGLPEPEINVVVNTAAGKRIAEVDLLYREAKIAIEYEGDHHRTNSKTFRRDLERERKLRASGYEYVRVTVETLRDGGEELVRDMRRLLAARIRPATGTK